MIYSHLSELVHMKAWAMGQHREDDAAQAPTERRRSPRAPLHRVVIYAPEDPSFPLRDGVAVDISARGMQIRTARPEQAGTHLQIELSHTDGGGSVEPPSFSEAIALVPVERADAMAGRWMG